MTEVAPMPRWRRLARLWPWLVLIAAAAAAVWHDVDFPEDVDPEFPAVVRPTFNRRPPPAYRLAEPGDTLDRIAIYSSAAGVVLSLMGLALGGRKPWLAALAVSAAAWWHAVTPGPTFDGWHGLGWRTMFDPSAAWSLRLALAACALLLLALAAGALWADRTELGERWRRARASGVAGLLIAAGILCALRQFEIPGVEPVGYWPRCALLCGLLAFDMALLRALPRPEGRRGWLRRGAFLTAGAGGWLLLVVAGIGVSVYHRPIDRFRAIVPGRIFISAMPTERGLGIIHERHHFKTIINLFPEDTEFRSPRLPEEMRFAEEHGIRYVVSSSDPTRANAFLDETLKIARDPDAWPILVHCHACMDRTPAWWGIYRFVVQGDTLDAILRDIERHRGLRPKASVTLLYNRVLAPRAPLRYEQDPTAPLLRKCAEGTIDPYFEEVAEAERKKANRGEVPRVSRRERVLP